MWNKVKSLSLNTKLFLFAGVIFATLASISSLAFAANNSSTPLCDGKKVTANCQTEDGTQYSKYIYHKAVKEVTKTINHPAEPAKTHVVHHDAIYGMRQVLDCIRTNISYKSGSCAQSRCWDGSYSGSSGRGTCSYHGGVAARGPWYYYRTEQYLITQAWDETVVDEPAKIAWTETVVVTPAKPAYYEKVEMLTN